MLIINNVTKKYGNGLTANDNISLTIMMVKYMALLAQTELVNLL